MVEIPGKGYGGYFKLKEIIERGVLEGAKRVFEFKDGFIFVDGTVIQGLRIIGSNAYIKGIHYSSWENATQIRSTTEIRSSLDDPFVYLSPRGAMQGWPESEIKRELGARSADTEIWLEIVVPIDKVWLKASRRIVHFAIEGNLFEENIVELRVQRRS